MAAQKKNITPIYHEVAVGVGETLVTYRHIESAKSRKPWTLKDAERRIRQQPKRVAKKQAAQ